MEKVIPLFSQLQEILHRANLHNTIQFPQIVAVGAQSTGKSSVLESILGKDLLPRGTGIVTRCPIVLQLNNTAQGSEEYIEFSHKKGEKYTDWNKARLEIEDAMSQIAGEKKAISATAIIISMYSPHVVNLNIVDLPGITKIPVGDQPLDIEQQVHNLIGTYIRNPNTIILAVSPANADLANSDSLKLAREVDPEGNRTIGVITKLDLMSRGTHCLDALEGKEYKLKLGFVGVVGRSHKDLENQKPLKKALEDEKEFFRNHESYRKYAERMGIDFLTRELSKTLLQQIKLGLPKIKETLGQMIQEKEEEMVRHCDNDFDPSNRDSMGNLVLSIISGFIKTYSEIIGGNYIKATNKELFGGARINYILYDILEKAINNLDPFETLTDEAIRVAIRNSNGLSTSLFLPESAFENLVKQQILRLRGPVFEAISLVNRELINVVYLVDDVPGITRFKVLRHKLSQMMQDIVERCSGAASTMMKNKLETELGYIDTSHPEFIGGLDTLLEVSKNEKEFEEYKNDELGDLGKMLINTFQEEEEKEKKKIEEPEQIKPLEIKEIFLDDGSSPEKPVPKIEEDKKVENNDENINKELEKLESLNVDRRAKMENIPDESQYKPKVHFGFSKNTKMGYSSYEEYRNPIYERVNLTQIPNRLRLDKDSTQKEMIEVAVIKKLIKSYFDIVKKNIYDNVIKTVMTFLVNRSRSECEKELVKNLYKEELFEKLLEEDPISTENRKQRRENMKVLKKCAAIINEVDSKL